MTVAIRGGTVVDGTGAPSVRAASSSTTGTPSMKFLVSQMPKGRAEAARKKAVPGIESIRLTCTTLVNAASGNGPFLLTVRIALPIPAQFTVTRSSPNWACSVPSSGVRMRAARAKRHRPSSEPRER